MEQIEKDERDQRIAGHYGMTVEEVARARQNAIKFVGNGRDKNDVLNELCAHYDISREAGMCAISCGFIM